MFLTFPAKNLNFTQLLGILRKGADNLIYQFKNDPTINQILSGLNQVTSIFLPEAQEFTSLSAENSNKAKRILNILAPSEAKKRSPKNSQQLISFQG
jgi:hypothetical protein